MKKNLHSFILLMLLNSCFLLQAQWHNGLWTEKQAYNWFFCKNAGLNFEQIPPVPLPDSQVDFLTLYNQDNQNQFYEAATGSSVMSDSEGNLLFYTNGNTVWNRNHQVMINGTDLISGGSGKQNNIIVPAPGNPDKYFIFSIKNANLYGLKFPFPVGHNYNDPKVVYTEVDMSLDSGIGGVTGNKNVLLAGSDQPAYANISATYHSDGHQIWVMMHGQYNNEYLAYLVSDTGVSMTPVVSAIGFSTGTGFADGMTQMKFSPDGTKIVKSCLLYDDQKNVEVFNFDKTTGKITSLLVSIGQEQFMNDGEFAGAQGLEFSPNSKLLYMAGVTSGIVKQYNLEAGDQAAIKASGISLTGSEDPLQFNHYMQVAPDGKIYVAYSEEPFGGYGFPMALSTINVIDFPNNVGISSGFHSNAIDLGSGKSGHSFPSFIQDYFASGILYDEGKCPGEGVSFSTLRIPGIESIVWDFGDPASGADNSSTDLEPVHVFNIAGIYTVTAVITSNGAQQTAITKAYIIVPDAMVPSANDLTKCADNTGTATFDLTTLDAIILAGQSAEKYTVTYYASSEDAGTGNAIVKPNELVTGGQVIYAVVTNTTTGCITMIEFSLVVNPLPVAGNTAQNMELCGNISSKAVFNLTQQTSAILDGQDPVEFSVLYYTDAGLTNQIQQPEAFESGGQTIYATVINNATGCTALAVPQFEIIVLPLPTLPEITTFYGCSPFDLITMSGEPEEGTVYSFHTSEEDAVSNMNAIITPDKYIVQHHTGSVYIRALNNEGCIHVGELLLKPGDCFIPRGISPNNDGMNDSFDLSGFDIKFITIFNRYGQEVYSKSNYINEWIGQSNKGDELPSGTYYYMIKNGEGEDKTGWVYINRQE
ncbi:hypothetical protein D3C87_419590 [compost metagenome]